MYLAIDDAQHGHKPKRRAVSLCQQTYAVAMKNIALGSKNRKTNCSYLLFAILMIVISIINGLLLVPNVSAYSVSPPNCAKSTGWFVDLSTSTSYNNGGGGRESCPTCSCTISDIEKFSSSNLVIDIASYRGFRSNYDNQGLCPFPPVLPSANMYCNLFVPRMYQTQGMQGKV